MFKVLMNGNVADTARIYGSALRKAQKIKELFCKIGEVTIEDPKGRIIERLGSQKCS